MMHTGWGGSWLLDTHLHLQKRELDDPEVSSALAGGLAGRSLTHA